LLFSYVQHNVAWGRLRLQYTIEARELTTESTHRPAAGAEPRRTMVEATDAGEAIARFVQQNASELVSLSTPAIGRESIATVKKDDSVYLVRVYAA
jgi:hypothetical protein